MDDGGGDHVVEKAPVVADQEDRAVVIGQQLFEQFQRLDVQVIGRLVEHQYVGRAGKQAGQQQAVALAAGQALDRRVGPCGREQKVAQIALDVFALAADLDPFAARADGVGQGGFHVERIAHLVKIGHVDLGAHPHHTAVGGELAQDHLQQGRLARAVGTDQADLVAAQDGGGEVAHDDLVAVAFVDAFQLGDDLAAGPAGVNVQLDLALYIAALGMGRAHRLQPLDAGDAAGTAGLDALPDPDFFLRQDLVEAGVEQRLVLQLVNLGGGEGGEVAGIVAQRAAVEFDDAVGDVVEKGAVVGDQQQRALEILQQLFQPGDRIQIQVVGGLVEQQHIGLGHQRAAQGDALLQPTGERADQPRAIDIEPVQGLVDALLPVPRTDVFDAFLHPGQVVVFIVDFIALAQGFGLGHALADDFKDRRVGAQLGLLRHIDTGQALLKLEQAVIELLELGEDLQQ